MPKLESKISARLKHMNTDLEVLNVLRLINQISKQTEDKQEFQKQVFQYLPCQFQITGLKELQSLSINYFNISKRLNIFN